MGWSTPSTPILFHSLLLKKKIEKKKPANTFINPISYTGNTVV